MQKMILLIPLLLLGCTMRMAAFAPHPPDNDAHRNLAENKACFSCHDPAALNNHQANDNCLRCHRVVKGR